MEESGIVMETSADTAKVKLIRTGGCEGCGASKTCKAVSDTENTITVINNVGAAAGQHVTIEITSGVFLKATFITYILPVVGLFVGAALGGKYGTDIYSGIKADYWQAIGGIIFFFISVAIIRLYDRMLSHDRDLMPVITKVLD